MISQILSRRSQLFDRVGVWLKRPLAHKRRSVAVKVRRGIERIEDIWFEWWHGLDCGGRIRNSDLETAYAAALPYARNYEAITCALVRQLLKEAEKTGVSFDNFIDLGSGKGKACFYAAARYDFRRIIGVEFSGPLVAAANANNKNFGNANISFINIDAALFSLPPGDSLVFLFNPFGELVLEQFLENSLVHFRESRSLIAYANDQHRRCLERYGFAVLYRNQDSQASLYHYIGG